MAMATVAGVMNSNGVGPAPPLAHRTSVVKTKQKSTAVTEVKRKHDRQHSLRHANSVELAHRRLNSDSSHAQVGEKSGLTGREGRKFTVANVGQNGMIFLRPVIRPATQAPRAQVLPTPTYVFPAQPCLTEHDGTYNLDSKHLQVHDDRRASSEAAPESVFSGTGVGPRSPTTPTHEIRPSLDQRSTYGFVESPTAPRVHQHHRAHSFSTLDEKHKSGHVDISGARITIASSDDQRPRTAESVVPTLEANIPNHRLGSQKLNPRVAAVFRGSVGTHASTTDGVASSTISDGDYDQMFPLPPSMPRSSPASPSLQTTFRGQLSSDHRGPPWTIESRMFDDLTFRPRADDTSVVRYSRADGSIIAATPARLIAQITSPNFLDYDLLSDFFLTFRSYLSTLDLNTFLMARLQWAIDRTDDVGKIVKVRTFVAMRHWILNYFVDDFVPDLRLRMTFCDSVNEICKALRTRQDAGRGHIKLIGELKKCWRRTGDLYWDGPAVSDDPHAGDDLLPGGLAGIRATPVFLTGRPLTHEPRPPPMPEAMSSDGLAHFTGQPPSPSLKEVQGQSSRLRPEMAAIHGSTAGVAQRVMSASSDSSVQVLSCSIPAKGFRRIEAVLGANLGAHPVPSMRSSPVPTAVRLPSPIRQRRPGSHQRTGSLSEVVEDAGSPQPQLKPGVTVAQPVQGQKRFLHPGSLIRGNLIPPSRFLVSAIVPNGCLDGSRTKVVWVPHGSDADEEMVRRTNGMTNPAMRKLLGSVRRALGNKHMWTLEPGCGPESLIHTHTSSERRSSPGSRRGLSKLDVESPPDKSLVRVDVLHEKIFEAFKDIRKEEVKTAVQAAGEAVPKRGPKPAVQQACALPRTPPPEVDAAKHRSKIPSTVTMGSKSIIIIDDTRPSMLPVMSGGLPAPLPTHGRSGRTASRSLAAHARLREALSSHPRVSTVTLHDPTAVGLPQTAPVPSRAAYSSGDYDEDAMDKATQAVKSDSRAHPSFQSGVTRQETVRSFDATTLTESDRDSSDDLRRPTITRVLRRRPGGDLRATQRAKDLESPSRPRSAGSVTTRCSSVFTRVSGHVTSVGGADSEEAGSLRRRFSLGALAEVHDERGVSMMHTHSSQPNLRPSFEAEVAKLARIPDGDEDGGVESTLLKLEGRFDRRGSDESPTNDGQPRFAESLRVARTLSAVVNHENPCKQELEPMASRTQDYTTPTIEPVVAGTHRESTDLDATLVHPLTPELRSRAPAVAPLSPSILSEESYSSIPLLERGWSERSPSGDSGPSDPCSSHSTPRASVGSLPAATNSHQAFAPPQSKEPMNGLQETFLLDDDDPTRSFLLDDDEDLSDLSSEMSLELHSEDAAEDDEISMVSCVPVEPAVVQQIEGGLSNHPLRHPPTPPPWFGQSSTAIPTGKQGPSIFPQLPLTPEASPVEQSMVNGFAQKSISIERSQHPMRSTVPAPSAQTSQVHQLHVLSARSMSPEKASSHLPFILAHDPELLARQFTLCEKDALSEVDWRDLVELRWRQTLPAVQNWVDFLKLQEPKGVELVIARFNVMVKWALSEIVLTQDLRERARTISHYIRIAAFARSYRNYATMYQVAVAVLSTDCSRLTETWELVPDADIRTLRSLEALIQPTRNFHNLRVEMETATAEEGCVPFIGIYTHDLVFNSHRPSRIDSSGSEDGLINFERHRVTAAIVKNLLRLVDGSSKYEIQPVEGVIERCLWMAALPDEEIHALSKKIQ